MTVDPAHAAGSYQYGGKTWYFCNPSCLERFRADPERYINPKIGAADQPSSPAPGGVLYTCPMHPQVVQNGPGSCPYCGMALEPKTISLEEVENPELRDMQRRFWVSVILTTPILLMTMGEMIAGQPLTLFPGRAAVWIQFLLATPVVLWGGWPFFERAWSSIVHRSPNMFTLIAMGTGTAYLYSVAAALVP